MKAFQFLMSLIWLLQTTSSNGFAWEPPINPQPFAVVKNSLPNYTLINSVDFHPTENLFCVTYTQGNCIILYRIDPSGNVELVQTLKNPLALLSEPQHAIFSTDGKKIIAANWTNQTLTVYDSHKNDLFYEVPTVIIPASNPLKQNKPHGIVTSPCGNYLAIAFGASTYYEQAIGIFRITKKGNGYELINKFAAQEGLPGAPKGIVFSPDGNCLLVTFSNLNNFMIYDLDAQKSILPIPRQIIQGPETGISRPEDIKISSDKKFCAVTNSDRHTVTFYSFDKESNRIADNVPYYTLEAKLCSPHGVAFSPDGAFMVVTEFGQVFTANDGGIGWKTGIAPEEAKFSVYKMK
jgi:6-phosphogluconolactonase (cycloisomerase 2 family)